MKKLPRFLGMVALAALIWVAIYFYWVYQPWMPAGRAEHLRSEHVGAYDFEVWQRKNKVVSEPFATALFARKGGGPWSVFLLDVDDSYRSSIVLKAEGTGAAVFQDNRRLGFFDETQGVLRRSGSEGEIYEDAGNVLNSEPPGDWWLEATRP